MKISPQLPFILLTSLGISNLQAAVYSFANTTSPITIVGTDDGTGAAITFTSTTVATGTGTADTTHGDQTPTVGNHTYTGAVISDPGLSSQVTSDPSQMALISARPYGDVGNGDTGETYHNSIGIHVQFSAPIEMFTFAMLDFDGARVERREWGTSWGYNSVTMASIAPTMTLNSTTSMAMISGVDANALYSTLNAPTSLGFAELTVNANAVPDDLENQVVFDYNGGFVTDLYFLYGAQGNATNAGQSSGVTGFVVNDALVPEPSSSLLIGMSFIAGLFQRRRRH